MARQDGFCPYCGRKAKAILWFYRHKKPTFMKGNYYYRCDPCNFVWAERTGDEPNKGQPG
jgi:rubredoxin